MHNGHNLNWYPVAVEELIEAEKADASSRLLHPHSLPHLFLSDLQEDKQQIKHQPTWNYRHGFIADGCTLLKMNAIDLSCYVGLAAMTMLTLNILLGLLLSTRYNPMKQWPHRKIPIFAIHNWNGYSALFVAMLHPAILMFAEGKLRFRFIDIIYPLNSPVQPNFNILGAIALYLLIFVVVTTYFRPQLGNRRWKKLHFFTYALAFMLYSHSIVTNPELKNVPLDPLDGEKVYVEGCALLVVAGIIWRVRTGSKLIPTTVR
jgi:DMSO/TMAO reductase YedYZ heme-binding membrane subunit